MESKAGGFREIEHTADWELEVWSHDLKGLLEQAARGMYALSGVRLLDGPVIERQMELDAPDRESLLVSFLSELLYVLEQENLAFQEFDISVNDRSARSLPDIGLHLGARLIGVPVEGLDKEIKAVTYHMLSVRSSSRGLEAHLVFDV